MATKDGKNVFAAYGYDQEAGREVHRAYHRNQIVPYTFIKPNRMNPRSYLVRFWRTETAIFFLLWLIFISYYGRNGAFLRDQGSFWHTKVGELALQTGEIPHKDHFSFTFPGKPWHPIAGWLSQVIMGGLHRLGGLDAIVLATATILAAMFTWVAHRFLRTGAHWLLTGVLLLLLYLTTGYYFHARPHLATMVLLCWTYAYLVDWEAGRTSGVRLLWLIPGFALWANLHGGALGGIATLGFVLAVWMLMAWFGAGPLAGQPKRLVLMIALSAACLLALLANPYHVGFVLDTIRVSQSQVVTTHILEHQPLVLNSNAGRSTILLAGLYAAALIQAIRQGKFRGSWLAPIPWFILGYQHQRHAPLFSLVAVVALMDIWHVAFAEWLAKHGSWLFRDPETEPYQRQPAAWIIPGVAVAGAFICLSLGIGSGWAQLDESRWPVELLPQLEQYEAENDRIFNEMTFGGFLIYHTPKLRVFIDDRCEFYGDEFLLEYIDAGRKDGHPEKIEAWAKEYGFTLAIVRANSEFGEYLSKAPGWEVVGRAEYGPEENRKVSALLLRKKQESQMPKR